MKQGRQDYFTRRHITREECDKTRKAVAEESLPICRMLQQDEGGLPMEIEIALANINWRKKAEMERKENVKWDAVNNDEALPTQDGCCITKPPSKKRGTTIK